MECHHLYEHGSLAFYTIKVRLKLGLGVRVVGGRCHLSIPLRCDWNPLVIGRLAIVLEIFLYHYGAIEIEQDYTPRSRPALSFYTIKVRLRFPLQPPAPGSSFYTTKVRLRLMWVAVSGVTLDTFYTTKVRLRSWNSRSTSGRLHAFLYH